MKALTLMLLLLTLPMLTVVTAVPAQACECPPPPCCPGTGTPGFWKNHPDAWPVESIMIGGEPYTKAEAIAIMDGPVRGDKTITMFKALVAAKLNVLAGCDDSCIRGYIEAADAWMEEHGPVGSNVRANSCAWQHDGEDLYCMLDRYNNGQLCVPARD
jgi:hypothetical protein